MTKTIKLKDGTIVSSQDTVFGYDVVSDNSNYNIPIGHDVWYEDICEFFSLTLKEAMEKTDTWYWEVFHNKDGFKDWVEDKLRKQYPSARLC